MSKKKKFAGKKTKLAKHALTQVLAAKAPAGPEPSPAADAALTLAQTVQNLRQGNSPLPLVEADYRTFPTPQQLQTAQTYLQLVQELAAIRDLLRAPGQASRPVWQPERPWLTISPEVLHYALQLVQKTLRELRPLLD